jgi:hypothetical protein
MADEVWRQCCARYTPAAVAALATSQMHGERVAVALARSVVTAPLRAVALPLLAGASRVYVRASRSQQTLVATVASALGGDVTVVDEVPRTVDRVMAYGRDETLDALAASLAPQVRFEGRGHGFGLAYVDTVDEDTAHAVARDVALYDQQGCLSPQQVFVRGDAVQFAQALHRALATVGERLPRAPLPLGDATAVMQWQGEHAARCVWFRRGETHAVGCADPNAIAGTPGWRNVLVCEARDEADVCRVLGAALRAVTVLGVTGMPTRTRWGGVMGRVVAVGTMQDPPLDGHEDVRPFSSRRKAP